MKQPKNMRLSEAASRIGCCTRHARRVFLKLDRENPGLGIVTRPSGNPDGRIEISPLALALLRQKGTAEALEELSERVGMLESDHGVLRTRLGGAEKRIRKLETCSFVNGSGEQNGTFGTRNAAS